MKKIIQNNIKIVIAFSLGAIIFSTITYAATVSFASGDVEHTYSNGSKTNVAAALNDLYTKANQGDAAEEHILSGKKALSSGTLLTGSMSDYSNGAGQNATLTSSDSRHVYNVNLQSGDSRVWHGPNSDGVYRLLIGIPNNGYYTRDDILGVPESDVATAIGVDSSKMLSGYGVCGVWGSIPNRGNLDWKPNTGTVATVEAGYYTGGTLDSRDAYNQGIADVIANPEAYGIKIAKPHKVTLHAETTWIDGWAARAILYIDGKEVMSVDDADDADGGSRNNQSRTYYMAID